MQINRYLGELRKYGKTWRRGNHHDYMYRSKTTGWLVTKYRGLPLPGGKVALVLPSLRGVIMYVKINPKLPRVFIDVIVFPLEAEAEAELALAATETVEVAATTTATANSLGAGTTIFVQVTETVAVGTEAAYVGEATMVAAEATNLTATMNAVGGVP